MALLTLAIVPVSSSDAADIGSTVDIAQSLAFTVSAEVTAGDSTGAGLYTLPGPVNNTLLDFGTMNSVSKTQTTKTNGVKIYVETNAVSYDVEMEIDQLMTSGANTSPNSTGSKGFVWSTAHDGTGWTVFGKVGAAGTVDTVASGSATSGETNYVDYRLNIDPTVAAGTYSNTTTYTLVASY